MIRPGKFDSNNILTNQERNKVQDVAVVESSLVKQQ